MKIHQKLSVFLLLGCIFGLHAQDYPITPTVAKAAAYSIGSGLLIAGITHKVWQAGDAYIFNGYSSSNQKFDRSAFAQGFCTSAFLTAVPNALGYVALGDSDKEGLPVACKTLHAAIGFLSATYGLSDSCVDVCQAAKNYRSRLKYLDLRDGKDTFDNAFVREAKKKDSEVYRYADLIYKHAQGNRDELEKIIAGQETVTFSEDVMNQWNKAEQRAKEKANESYFSYTCGKLAGTLTSIAAIGGIIGWKFYNMFSNK